ncbi:hypothetical protein BUALT_Bualt02G0100600 [Buddleja alternifolia]|uniref:TF-B3 domain-containing protein n=1 Tax=Buddleja alternifolia TaxID=168488 RepID=A0AAV6XZ36_9LAMI|nr:hypothetical protein BUALT_Bualt02G0100600 [Buddleja alternifolia]
MPSARKEKLSLLKMLIVPGCLEEMRYLDEFVRRSHLNTGSHLTVRTSLGTFNFGVELVNGRVICERAEWLRFVAVHIIEFGEFVFFRHRGRMVFDATVIVPSMPSKKYDVEPVTSSDSSDDEDDDDDDSIDKSEADMDNGDNSDASEELQEFELTILPNSGFDYHTPHLAALGVVCTVHPNIIWREHGLDRKRAAAVKAVRCGATTKEVGRRWKNNAVADGRGTFWLKDGWHEFVEAEGIKGGNHLVITITGESGDKVRMDVLKLNQSLSIDSNNTTVIRYAMDELNCKLETIFTFAVCKSGLEMLIIISLPNSFNNGMRGHGNLTCLIFWLLTRRNVALIDTFKPTMIAHLERKLERHYRAFTQMIACEGVEWDEARCIVRASKQQWEEWRVTIPLSRAYIYYSDDKYEDLKRLYASPYAGTLTNPWEDGMVPNVDEEPCPEYDSDYYDEDDEPKYIDTTRNFGCCPSV